MGHRTLIYQDAFNHQELEVELARKALNLSVSRVIAGSQYHWDVVHLILIS